MKEQAFDPQKMQDRIDALKEDGKLPRLNEFMSAMQKADSPTGPKKKKVKASLPKSKLEAVQIGQK